MVSALLNVTFYTAQVNWRFGSTATNTTTTTTAANLHPLAFVVLLGLSPSLPNTAMLDPNLCKDDYDDDDNIDNDNNNADCDYYYNPTTCVHYLLHNSAMFWKA